MLRYKQFSGKGAALEETINRWLEQFEPDVTQMVQTVAEDNSVFISFLFEESFRGQEIRLSAEHGVSSHVSPAVPPEVYPDKPLIVQEDPVPPAESLDLPR
jgi:hypothetical protein